MTTTRQLYSVQELDLALAHIGSKKAEAERELAPRISLQEIEAALQGERDRLQQFQSSHRIDQLEVESLRARSAELETKLYSGAVANPRDLESMEKEVSNTRDQLQQRDASLLELSLKAEESRLTCDTLERKLSDTRTAWESRQAELKAQIEGLTTEQSKVTAQRAQLAATVEPTELNRYESLRKTKGGRAVAKVERGLCQACRMSLPTQQLQRVRTGRQTVLCSSCGRMLFIG